MKEKNNKKEMDVVFLLDRSGSMRDITTDTIGGYNSYIDSLKTENVKVTTVLFDDHYEMLTNREDIKNIKKLDEDTYYARGMTALLDAVGKTIRFMEKNNPKKVMFIITTDGYENASKKYTKEQIKELIQGHKDWEFMYIGADIDSYGEGASLGISSSNIANYEKNERGVNNLFKSLNKASRMYYMEEEIKEDWKEDLEETTKKEEIKDNTKQNKIVNKLNKYINKCIK